MKRAVAALGANELSDIVAQEGKLEVCWKCKDTECAHPRCNGMMHVLCHLHDRWEMQCVSTQSWLSGSQTGSFPLRAGHVRVSSSAVLQALQTCGFPQNNVLS